MSQNNTQLQLEAKLFKGFSDPSRLAILELLSEKPLSVSEIVEKTGLSQPNVSMHLACLLGCGLLQNKKDRRNSYYELSGNDVREIIKMARKVIGEHTKEIFECTRY